MYICSVYIYIYAVYVQCDIERGFGHTLFLKLVSR